LDKDFARIQIMRSAKGEAGHEKHGDGDDQDERYYKDHDRDTMRGWYDEHKSNPPPGLAKRDQLPPDWKNNLCGAARSRLGSRNGCNPVLKTLSGGYPRHLPIARTF
jgi:hypothetical protein